MPKLYRSAKDLQHWYVHEETRGWIRFPARIDGWADRQPIATLQGLELREVPLRLSFNTGMPTGARRLHRAA